MKVFSVTLHINLQYIKEFQKHRPPGIYKESYLSHLFGYYHEPRPEDFKAPAEPSFKQTFVVGDAPRLDPLQVPSTDLFGPTNVEFVRTVKKPEIPMPTREADTSQISPEYISHEDLHLIGEPVPPEQKLELMRCVSRLVLGQHRFEHESQLNFPGAQPVSMDRSNMDAIRQPDWAVTWKADGTRYMLLVMHDGAYLINRKYDMARVEMRFPVRYQGEPPQERYNYRHAPPQGARYHHLTLLDGELVRDNDPEAYVLITICH